MPTGYTAKLYNGEQSFEEFVLECSGLLEKDGTNGPALRQEACIRAGLTK